MQINKHNITHKQNQEQKPHLLNKCRKSPQQNSISYHDKSSEELGIKGTLLNNIKAIFENL
jgi:hypothetical protein